MSIRLKLEGFDELIKEIQKAEGNVEKATIQCMQKSGQIMHGEIKSAMQKANKEGTFSDLIERMPEPSVENDHGLITARVGFKKGNYDPRNLSDGYKAVFLNYGTPNRTKHGVEKARGFLNKAKSKAKKQIQQQQEAALKDILKGLKK